MSFHSSQIPEIPYSEKDATIPFGELNLNRITQGSTSREDAKNKERAKPHYSGPSASRPYASTSTSLG